MGLAPRPSGPSARSRCARKGADGAWLIVLAGWALACGDGPGAGTANERADLAPPSPAASSSPPPIEGSSLPTKASQIVVLAGGDVNLGREAGQRILAAADYDPFRAVAPWLANADLRFVHLESPLWTATGASR